MKRLILILAALVLILFIGLFVWARAALTGDGVRRALEAQLTRALGQPVAIGQAGVSIFPRVTLDLSDVTIGQPARVTVRTLHVGADLRALISRRIEHADVRLDGARVQLPLPPFAFLAQADTANPPARAPVEIVSVDAVSFRDVEIVSGGRTLRGSVDLVPVGRGADVRRIALETDDTALEISGRIDDLAGPTGELTAAADTLDVPALLAFVNDFAAGSGLSSGSGAQSGRAGPQPRARTDDPSPTNLVVTLSAKRAVVGALALAEVKGRARVTPDRVSLDPLEFQLFGGSLSGVVTSPLGGAPAFHANARVSGLDVAAIAAFAGSPGTITGRLSGTIDLGARGASVEELRSAARGNARVTIADGTVTGLGLVRSVVLATSMREGAGAAAASTRDASSVPEPFSALRATVAVAGGRATTDDLEFMSPDVSLTGAGVLELSTLAVEVAGRVQLSEALSKQAGRDLVRYTQDEGRVTLPVRVSGTPGRFRVGIDMSEAARRAITNRAADELLKALGRIKKGGGGVKP
jgi:uncharacterized protein involved in outer membrane biogenesis